MVVRHEQNIALEMKSGVKKNYRPVTSQYDLGSQYPDFSNLPSDRPVTTGHGTRRRTSQGLRTPNTGKLSTAPNERRLDEEKPGVMDPLLEEPAANEEEQPRESQPMEEVHEEGLSPEIEERPLSQ